ncbi:hypothetical protein [Cellulomonas shaoxiangyii]|uniref:Uncharacterized protein n=1 Tax=Cellulomonas shaoxiangyii TaxID=2566013 RepID=A0A4V1CMG8_9CELL|nr:hypothetical protein [Cellulomonas shaoxiangyii]QCB92895.1 hypothetical protein E5225_04335 [Cellulomonas shaoxiangyii]TGY85417.1 hypothetical protein E5226_06910 [Cellulomonas shaoxiangyii]
MSTAGASPLPRRTASRRRPAASAPADAAGGAADAHDPWPQEATGVFTARTWGGYAALGTGLVLVGLGAGHLDHHVPAALLLLPLGAAALVAAVLALRGDGRHLRVGGPLVAASGAAALLVGLATAQAGTAELTAAGLGVVGGVLLAVAGRLGARTGARSGVWARLGLLAAGALLASAATVNGLAATEAGAHAVPHGLHGLVGGGHHG